MNNPLRLRQLAISELISNYFSPLRYHRRKKNLFFFQFPENLTSIKKLIIHQLLKISFWYLFYFRSYKAKNNLKVEQKARDLWHFMSTSSRHLINVLYTEFRNRSFVIKSTYFSSFRKLERLVFASQVLFLLFMSLFPFRKKGKFIRKFASKRKYCSKIVMGVSTRHKRFSGQNSQKISPTVHHHSRSIDR